MLLSNVFFKISYELLKIEMMGNTYALKARTLLNDFYLRNKKMCWS